MNIFDHTDYRKSGRALILVSVSYLLLDQCSVGFDSAKILGIKVYLTKGNLQFAFGLLAIIFLIVFAIRVYLSVGSDQVLEFRKHREDQKTDMIDSILEKYEVSPTDGHRYNAQVQRRNGREEFANEIERLERQAKRRAKFDFLMLLVTETLPPVLAFIAAVSTFLFDWYPIICPLSPLGWPLP